MTHHIELLQKLLSAITKAVSIILLIVTFFILQYLLDMDYVCSCNPDSHITGIAVFMALPPFILSCLVTLIESCYKKTIYYHGFLNFIQFSIFFVGKYMFLTCIWGGTVMLEGDWYICLKTNIDRNHTGIACEENLTNEEKHTKAKYKNESMNIAFYVLTVLFTIWNIYELCKPFCMRIFNKNKFTGLPSYYRWMYEELLSEEVSNHLKEELKNIAEEKAKKLCEGYLKDIRKAELQRQPENHDSNNSNNSNSNDERNPKDSGSEAVSTDTLMSNSDSNADQNSSVTAAWHKISEPHFYLNDCAQVGQS